MDRNREARRAAAMANGLQRRRQHRTTTNSAATLRDSPEEEGQVELPETAARLRDRTGKKDRDREMRDRDRDRDRERERLSRSKRRRRDKYMHGGGGNIREDGGGGGGGNSGVDDSSEESVNDEEDDEEDSPYNHHHHHHLPPPNPVHVPPAVAAGTTLTSHRKSYPPPSKVYRVTPSWKAPDEMIGVSIPRKARSASTKRSHECWSSGGVGGGGDQINRQSSSSPVTDAAAVSANIQSPSPARPMSPSSSNISMKKKIKPNGPKQRPPKSSSTKSPPVIQDEIEIEVAEVLYGLMRSQAPPSSTDSAAVKLESRSTVDSKPPPPTTTTTAAATSSSSPLTVIAPKRKRPRLSSDEVPRGTPIPKLEAPSLNSDANEGSVTATKPPSMDPTPPLSNNNGILSDKMVAVKESSGEVRNGLVTVRASTTTTKVEEASSSSPKLESSQTIDRVQLSSTSSIKPSSLPVEKEHRREDKCQIDLMAPASPENGGTSGGDEKMMVVTDMEIISNETKSKPKEAHDDKPPVKIAPGGAETVTVDDVAKVEKSDHYHRPHQQHSKINLSGKEKSFDLQLDLENDTKLNLQPQKQPRHDSHLDKIGGQSSSVPLPMSMPTGWHGGLAPMGYVGPLQGVVSMDGTTMATPPIQPPLPHFLFSQPKPKRCAIHGHIAKSISAHQQMMKLNPFWPAAAAAGTAQLLGAKPYNLNLVPSTDLHSGRGGGVQDIKGPPFTLFPGPPPTTSTKDKSPQAGIVNDSSHKQFLSQPGLPPGSTNIMHGPALFFPMGQQQAAASARPGSGKSPSTGGAASTSTSTSASMGAAASNAPPAGPAMSFSYPNVTGNEAQFMAILGNNPYPFPIPAHVGAAPPYRGSHPQAMSFFNGSFYSSQMLHPSQLQQAQTGPVSSQSMQLQQQQNQQIASISTASSSSQKHLQGQQQRHQGSGASNNGNNPNQSSILQNFQGTKGREMGGEDSPSSADSRRSNMSLYGPNFPMPFHSPNFALIPSSLSGGANNGPGVPNVHNHGDKKQQQQSQQAAMNSPFPMSFTTINGVNTPGLDISSMAHNHALFQSLPEAAKQSYQMMAAAAAAQAAQQRMTSYRGPDDGKSGAGMASEQSNLDDERRAMAARATNASGGQSIAFSRDLAENSVVDSSARSLNLGNGSSRPARSSGSNNATHSTNSQQQQQHQSQMLFPKQQQYTPSSAGNARSKTPSTSNGNVYPDHLTSSSIMAAKFQNNLSGFPSLVQSSGGGAPTPQQWKNSVRPNTSQMSSPSLTTSSTPPNLKNLPQQQGRPQHTQISFGAAVNNSKPNPSSQGPQTQNATQAPSSPMMVGSPSNSSMSKSAGGSPRTSASNKSVGQTSTLSNQQGKNSPSPSLSNQKPSILGGPHVMSTPSAAGKPQSQQQPHQQPQLSKQSIQQAQLYFSNFMQQQAANTSSAMASPGYYLQRHPKSHAGSGPPTSSSGMLSLSTPVSFANVSTSDPTKAVASSNVKGGLNSQGMSQSGGSARQLMPASLPYTSTAPPVKPTEQKHPAGE